MTDNHTPSNPSPKPKLPSNFNALTFTAACPSCGAPVEFASAGSVMAVCEYCQTTVIREGDSLKAQGKQSLTLEDYSPLQVGSVGRFGDTDFAIIGRIQYRYEQGVWNEWYVQFTDGRNGWLSEALGQYSLTFEGVPAHLPSYNELAINDTVTFDGVVYRVTDRRSADAIAGEGELPYVVDSGWRTWVIDAQFMRQFITLDYGDSSENGLPTVYQGQAVDLADLDMQLLKDDRQINAAAGQAGLDDGLDDDLDDDLGDPEDSVDLDDAANPAASQTNNQIIISKIECPNCGSPVPYIEGKTDFIICPACHTESKLTGSTAEMLAMHSTMQSFVSTLPLGAKARIADADLAGVKPFATSQSQSQSSNNSNNPASAYHDYVVIGIMRLNEVGERALWTEYLLYSLSDGFLWLSEESSGWFVSRVLSEMPQVHGNTLVYDNRQWHLLYESYQNRVIFAIGAFNWQVKVNDQNTLMDYGNGDAVITSEQTEREITYTIAQPLPYNQLKQWFAAYLAQNRPANQYVGTGQGSLKGLLIWHFILQFIVLLMTGGSIIVAIIVAILIYSIYFSRANSTGGSRDPFTHNSSAAKLFAIALIVLGLLFSLLIGAGSSMEAGTNSSAETNISNNQGGGGVIFIPSGGSSGSGRGGFSSGGSHK